MHPERAEAAREPTTHEIIRQATRVRVMSCSMASASSDTGRSQSSSTD
jgi:hypothetical protein